MRFRPASPVLDAADAAAQCGRGVPGPLLTPLDCDDGVDFPGALRLVADRANLSGPVVAVEQEAPGDGDRNRGPVSLVVGGAGVWTGEALQLRARVLKGREVRVAGCGKRGDFDVHVGDGG